MQVIRVQHRDTYGGPYVSSERDQFEELGHMLTAHNESHPNPMEEGHANYAGWSDELCAFFSYEQLEMWFTEEELCLLEKHGFYPTVVEARVLWVGTRQITIKRKEQHV